MLLSQIHPIYMNERASDFKIFKEQKNKTVPRRAIGNQGSNVHTGHTYKHALFA